VPRDTKDLLDLPLQYRWEFTRRHPYYQLFWRAAQRYRRNELTAGTVESDIGFVATQLLGMIGVTGEPVDPALTFEELGEVEPTLLSGTVQPMTLHSIITLLIAALPPAEMQVVRAVLDVAANPEYAVEGDETLVHQKLKAQSFLAQLVSARLDSYPDAPLYYIHLEASQRRIREDVEQFVRVMKKRRQIPERRSHIGEFEDCLTVWDLREGWNDGAYRDKAEQCFAAIAENLGRPKSSIANSYRIAFRRIIGPEFSNEMWLRVMGAMRLVMAQTALTNAWWPDIGA
jgi:hypothetical protein